MAPTPDCCEVWPKLLHLFQWMRPDGQPDLLMMPYYTVGVDKWRINFCPSCGKEVRGCIVKRERVF